MGSPPVTGSASSFRSSTMVGSFFYGRSSGAGPARAVDGSIRQAGIQFFAPAANGIDVQAGDACDGRVAAIADLLRLKARDPATLLFVEPLEKQVHLFMQESVGVIGVAHTSRALAHMHPVLVHDGLRNQVSAADPVVCS